ncbi:hypothetical protein RZS08_16595, partial [Arthrospira platensis SPKY1]|nr:hypothetical protein [Arthrospira platensis SPKY1]
MTTRRQLGYFHNLGIALTRAFSAFIGVDYRISFSAQCWHWEQRGKWRGIVLRPVVDFIFFWDFDHCRRAFET